MGFLPAEIIKKKRNGHHLSPAEIKHMVVGYTEGTIPDYQFSALLMAIYFNGMTNDETLALTKEMLESGRVINLDHIPFKKVDKHSTGGVGDKTSLILGPIVAACGLAVPMISGRGLGHTGGTLDKLESIPGFNTQISLDAFDKMLQKIGVSFIGQTKEICPADKKIYALRDVTATVESLPLICASIMSKKLAEGIDGLVLDVKYGSGAFMKSKEKSEELAKSLKAIGEGYGKKVVALLTNMNQPLGRFAGNSLEVQECVAIMKNETHVNNLKRDLYQDTRELSLQLSAHMLVLGEKAKTAAEGYQLAKATLESGKAFEKFEQLCQEHGGNLNQLPTPKTSVVLTATKTGWVSSMNTEGIGVCGLKIKMGRASVTDIIEPTAGFEFHKKVGEKVEIGEPLVTIYSAESDRATGLLQELATHIEVSTSPVPTEDLVFKVIV